MEESEDNSLSDDKGSKLSDSISIGSWKPQSIGSSPESEKPSAK